MSSRDRNKEDAIDRLSHCSDKAWALSDMDFDNLTCRGREGIVFLLRDLAIELEEIGEELRAERGNLKVVSDK